MTEASTLTVLALLPQRAPVLVSAFTTVRLPRPSLADIEAAWSDLTRAPGWSYSVRYDPERDVLVSQAVSLPEHQRLYRRITEIDKIARMLTITDMKETASADTHQAWLGAVNLAAERQLPLWSDDVAIRLVADGKKVPAFGTWALLTALVESGLAPDTRATDASAFADQGVIQLPAGTRESPAQMPAS